MPSPSGFAVFHEMITGVVTATTVFFAFIGRRFINKVDKTGDAVLLLAERINQHEKDDIGKYATVDQLQRVHDRIDEVGKKQDRALELLIDMSRK